MKHEISDDDLEQVRMAYRALGALARMPAGTDRQIELKLWARDLMADMPESLEALLNRKPVPIKAVESA